MKGVSYTGSRLSILMRLARERTSEHSRWVYGSIYIYIYIDLYIGLYIKRLFGSSMLPHLSFLSLKIAETFLGECDTSRRRSLARSTAAATGEFVACKGSSRSVIQNRGEEVTFGVTRQERSCTINKFIRVKLTA